MAPAILMAPLWAPIVLSGPQRAAISFTLLTMLMVLPVRWARAEASSHSSSRIAAPECVCFNLAKRTGSRSDATETMSPGLMAVVAATAGLHDLRLLAPSAGVLAACGAAASFA